MHVEYIDHMGSDIKVVDAARVSFDKASKPEPDGSLSERDKKLLGYLATNNHWSPFAHVMLSVRVTAPIFVARQLAKHQVGLAWNEVSRRYVDSEPKFQPLMLRRRAENVKQGSANEFPDYVESCEMVIRRIEELALMAYKGLLEHDVCPEQARVVLPQSMMTSWVWTGSLYGFARICKLRLDSHTQRETQEVAKQIAAICAEKFPESWKVLLND